MLVASFAVAALAASSSVLASEQGKTDYLLSSRYSSMGRPVKRGFQEGNGSSYNLTFVHVNDLHGHLDTFRHSGVEYVPSRQTVQRQMPREPVAQLGLALSEPSASPRRRASADRLPSL